MRVMIGRTGEGGGGGRQSAMNFGRQNAQRAQRSGVDHGEIRQIGGNGVAFDRVFRVVRGEDASPLGCNTPKSLIFAKILPRISRMTRISLEQKGTKRRRNSSSLPAFAAVPISSWGRHGWGNLNPLNPRNPSYNSFGCGGPPWAFWAFWAFWRQNQWKSLFRNHLHSKVEFSAARPSQTQSNPVKAFFLV